MADGTANRFNEGKIRHSLVPTYAQQEYAKVLNFGAKKYGDHNWQKGLPWRSVADSMMRHMQAFARGEDFDPETGLLHTAHIMCNAAFLTEYYKIYPQGDNRLQPFMYAPHLMLEVDEVLADFINFHNTQNLHPVTAEEWDYFDGDIRAIKCAQNGPDISEMDAKMNPELAAALLKLWLNVPKKSNTKIAPYMTVSYFTRQKWCPTWAAEWIKKHKYPRGTVHVVSTPQDIIELTKSTKTLCVVSTMRTFVELSKADICCYLLQNEYTAQFDIGHRGLRTLADLPALN